MMLSIWIFVCGMSRDTPYQKYDVPLLSALPAIISAVNCLYMDCVYYFIMKAAS
jgi:hypothetical protein